MSEKLKIFPSSEKPWYKKGLSFRCTECGKCCTGSPGYVWVEPEEMQEMAAYLQISLQEFHDRYVRKIGERFSLKELKFRGYDCVFLKDKKCSVYPCRPRQCRTYPFWPSVLRSEETWRRESLACEGIREEYEKVPYPEICKKLDPSG